SFACPKENETKEKGASNKAPFPLETRDPALWATLFLYVLPPYALKFSMMPWHKIRVDLSETLVKS
ncbi:MAG: hypothetical protein MJA30_10270, partial [Cytophagales bacterium]|nr:hypothetical protein [Cytophagales bacterium]